MRPEFYNSTILRTIERRLIKNAEFTSLYSDVYGGSKWQQGGQASVILKQNPQGYQVKTVVVARYTVAGVNNFILLQFDVSQSKKVKICPYIIEYVRFDIKNVRKSSKFQQPFQYQLADVFLTKNSTYSGSLQHPRNN